MIQKKTIFILGAGSSGKSLKYPLGFDLRKRIIEGYNSPTELRKKLFNAFNKDILKEFYYDFSRTPNTISIDRFINLNSEFQEIGKFAITHILLQSEYSSFYVMNDHNLKHWYNTLFDRMTRKITGRPEEFLENNVIFITFNYDLSLEYFLYKSFTSLFNQQKNEATEVIRQFTKNNIIHMYGKLHSLPWEDDSDKNKFEYGSLNDSDSSSIRVRELSQNIYTIREAQTINSKVITHIKEAKNILFMGFSFDPHNMSALGFNQQKDKTKRYGIPVNPHIRTTSWLTDYDKAQIKKYFGEAYFYSQNESIFYFRKTCNEFMLNLELI